jgi:hypothetical protein
MFNMEQAHLLKQAKAEEIMAILAAGSKFTGTGWSTGRASKALYEICSKALVKATIEPYVQVWLYALAIITGVDLPAAELPQELAEAAFAIASACEMKENEDGQEDVSNNLVEDEDAADYKFDWDVPEQELPRELMALWTRAQQGDQKIEIRKLLEAHPPLQHIPPRAPENNLCPEWRKKPDSFLKSVDQQLLNVIRLLAYQWIRPANTTAALQVWQYLCELHVKVCQERRELAVTGISRMTHSSGGDVLFTDEDVKAQRLEQNIQKISMHKEKKKFSRGGFLL